MDVNWKGVKKGDDIIFVKDTSFNPESIDDPYIKEAYIPEEYNLKIPDKGLQLGRRNELRHAVGIVAARSLKYFSTNGDMFNIFRTRGMAVWWLRHIYNSFNWWKAYVVNAEGERKDMPMLYIGEAFGMPGDKASEADIVLSAFENGQCIVDNSIPGGTIFAVGYSERGGLFNSPDMYGIKTIVGGKYKGAGVLVTYSITENLRRMAEKILKDKNKEISPQNISIEIGKMKIVVLDRPRHENLINTVRNLGADVILVKDDDLSPTLAVARNEIDLIVGAGGVPEAVLSAIIIEKLGGEMSLRILPFHVAQDEKLLTDVSKWNLFRKNEIDILKNFKIVRPGTEKEGEIPWDRILSSGDLASGKDLVFTASVIKKNPWIKYPDGREVPGVMMEPETGEIKVHVLRIVSGNIEIVPVIYRTMIKEYLEHYRECKEGNAGSKGRILIRLGKAYAEFGMFQKAKEYLQNAMAITDTETGDDLLQRCHSVYEYVKGLDSLANTPSREPDAIINHFKNVWSLDKEDKEGLRPGRMIKRFYEYLGDKYYHERKYTEAIACYELALKYSPHELKLYRKLNSIQMRDLIEEYFRRIDKRYQELNYTESCDWAKYTLGLALEIFYRNAQHLCFPCREPWLIFFRRTVLHGKKPSYKLAILIKLLRLYKELNHANDAEISAHLKKEFLMQQKEIDIILNYIKGNRKLGSIGELYFIKDLSLEVLSKLLLPKVRVESQNELEDADIPLAITPFEAMERRYKNILEEFKEGYRKEAQEDSYAIAEAYHYVGLALYHVGDEEGAKIYYRMAIIKFIEIIKKFAGITPVNAQYRIGNLYEEIALLFEKERTTYYKKAIDAYSKIIDEQESIKLFRGNIQGLMTARIELAKERISALEKDLKKTGNMRYATELKR